MEEIGANDSPQRSESVYNATPPRTDSRKVDLLQETPSPSQQDDAKSAGADSSVSMWPPSQATRDAVWNRLIVMLSTPSTLSRRYGMFPPEEIMDSAKAIEEKAYGNAPATASTKHEEIEILKLYTKEISKGMVELAKTRGSTRITTPNVTESRTNANEVPMETSMNEEPSDFMDTEA